MAPAAVFHGTFASHLARTSFAALLGMLRGRPRSCWGRTSIFNWRSNEREAPPRGVECHGPRAYGRLIPNQPRQSPDFQRRKPVRNGVPIEELPGASGVGGIIGAVAYLESRSIRRIFSTKSSELLTKQKARTRVFESNSLIPALVLTFSGAGILFTARKIPAPEGRVRGGQNRHVAV